MEHLEVLTGYSCLQLVIFIAGFAILLISSYYGYKAIVKRNELKRFRNHLRIGWRVLFHVDYNNYRYGRIIEISETYITIESEPEKNIIYERDVTDIYPEWYYSNE